jgi:Saxitoxin biosynthesis operon protein SxtJ
MDLHRSDNAELRNFGLLFGAFLATLFGVIPLVRHHFMPAWPWIVAALLGLLAFLVPAALVYPHRLWIHLGSALGWLNTRVLLSLVYLLIVVPIALLMRWFGGDPMVRKFEPARDSYRTPMKQRSSKHLERPF